MSDLSHLGGSSLSGDPVPFMPDVWGYVCLTYHVHSILDIGCGVGCNARWLLDHGFDVWGVEGLPEYVAKTLLPGDCIIQHDYTEGPWVPPCVFDLGLCTEFVEHVEARFVPNFVASFRLCRYVLMSFATPGQGGYHHVNEQPETYWLSIMENAGFWHLPYESAKLRATHTGAAHYGRNTLMLFKNTAIT